MAENHQIHISTLCGKDLSELRETHQRMLFEEFIPWWYEYGIDIKHGGFITQLEPDGTIITTDKNMWYQGRGLWTFAYLYNHFDKNQRHLDTAERTVEFILKYGRDAESDWIYILTEDGRPVSDSVNIFSGIFVIYGLVEYYRATQEKKYLDIAVESTRRIIERIEAADFRGVEDAHPPGARVHGLWMIFMSVITELLNEHQVSDIENAVTQYVDNILNHHIDQDSGLMIEVLSCEFSKLAGDSKNLVNIGHVGECVWMMKHEAERIGDSELVQKAIGLIPAHLEAGWDNDTGGLFWSVDAQTGRPILSVKSSWCHQEYLLSLLEAIEHGNFYWAREWYEKIYSYAFNTFTDREHGQWHRVVTADGELLPYTPEQKFIGNETRDVFHYPRYLMFTIQILSRMIER